MGFFLSQDVLLSAVSVCFSCRVQSLYDGCGGGLIERYVGHRWGGDNGSSVNSEKMVSVSGSSDSV